MAYVDYMNYMDYANKCVEPGLTWDWEGNCSSASAEAVSGVDLGVDDHYGIEIDKGMLKRLVEESIRDMLEEKENKPVIIQKYKMKHK
jgi:hypothetical protein